MLELFKMLAEKMTFPIWIKGMDGRFIFVNDEVVKLHRISKDKLIGHTIEEAFPEELAKKFNRHCNEVIESGQVVVKDLQRGQEYSQCSIIPLMDENNEIIALAGVIGVTNDVGRIRQKEHEIELQKSITRKIIDVLPGVIFYKDMDSKYVYANRECRDFYAERGVHNIFGKTDEEINPNNIQVERFVRDDKILAETKAPIVTEVTFKDKNGNRIYRENVKVPLIDENGEMIGVVGRALDITDKKLYQERLEYLSYTDILTGVKNRTCFQEKEKEFSEKEHMPLGVIMGDANGLKLVNDTFGHNEGDRLLRDIATVLKNTCENRGEVFRIGGDEFVVLIPNADIEMCDWMINKIEKACAQYDNDLFNISIALGASIKEDSNRDIYEVLKEAEEKVYSRKLVQNKSIKASILNALKVSLGVRSVETEQHTERVAVSAGLVGAKLQLERDKIDELKIAADLHDIGKIGISEKILLKPDKLTDEEYEIMKTHSEKGYRIVKASGDLKNVAEGVLYHHERWDGKGYPMGLKGDEIPLISRIISVCDSYDVMISNRVYKKAITKDMAIEELKKCSGTQFDPMVVEAFLEIAEIE